MNSSNKQLPPEGWLEVGALGAAHGLKGKIKCQLLTSLVEERTAPGTKYWTRISELELESAVAAGTGWLFKFVGLDDRSAVEPLRTQKVYAERIVEAGALITDHIGSDVLDQNSNQIGTVAAIIDNPAGELLELANGTLIPSVFIVESGTEPGVISVNVPDGLLDL